MQMILFRKDWAKYPTAIADWETPNTSFLKMARLLKDMGVKNHAFMLALINPKLKGINPHCPYLLPDTVALIAAECKINPWYYFREVVKAPAESGSDEVPFEANRGNLSMFWSFFNHIMYIAIQPRQHGKSFSADTLLTMLQRITCKNTKINIVTKDDDLRRKNVQRLKDILETLPPYLQNKTKGEPNNGEALACFELQNYIDTHVPQASPKAALKLGRGLTSSIILFDEPPFQSNIHISLPAILAASGAAIDRAKASGSPYGFILTTTAGKKDDRDGKYIYKLLQESAIWCEAFYDAEDEADLYRMVRANSTGGVLRINGTFDHRMLGKTDEQMREKVMNALAEGLDANRDFFNVWTSGSATSPFSVDVAERMAKSSRSIEHTEISPIGSYALRWYIPRDQIEGRMASSKFIIGLDTSNAGGGDDIAFVMIDAYTLEVVAAGNYNETSIITFAKWLTSIMVKYPNAVLIPENKSSGQAVIDYLLLMLPNYNIDPFKRIFNCVVNEQRDNPNRWDEFRSNSMRRDAALIHYKKLFGYATSGSGKYSRDEIYGTALDTAVRYGPDKLNDNKLVNQVLGLENRNGRIDHAPGEHDDMAFAWLLAIWFIYQGVGLDYYGIDSSRLVNDRTERMKTMSRAELAAVDRDEKARARVIEIVSLMGKEKDTGIISKYEQELRFVLTKIDLTEADAFSVDELIKKAKEQRKLSATSFQNKPVYGYQPGYGTYTPPPRAYQQSSTIW